MRKNRSIIVIAVIIALICLAVPFLYIKTGFAGVLTQDFNSAANGFKLQINKPEAPPAIIISDVQIISVFSRFHSINLDGITLANSRTYPYGDDTSTTNELFVPLRTILEAMGFKLIWSGETKTIDIINADKNFYFDNLQFTVNSNTAMMYSGSVEKEIRMIAKPRIENGILYISFKDLIKFFGIDPVTRNLSEQPIEEPDRSILFLRSFGNNTKYNEVLDECYDSTFLKWDATKNNYVYLAAEAIDLEYHLSKEQWVALYRDSNDPVDIALLYYIDSSEAYYKEHPIIMSQPGWNLNEEGMTAITQLGIRNIPALLTHVKEIGPFSVECAFAVGRMLGINLETPNYMDMISQIREQLTNADLAVDDVCSKRAALSQDDIVRKLEEYGVLLLPTVYDRVFVDREEFLLDYIYLAIPEQDHEKLNLQNTSKVGLKEILQGYKKEVEIIKDLL